MNEVIEQVKPDRNADKTYHASTGATVTLQKVSQMIVNDAVRAMVAPKPPKIHIEGKPEAEYNINDPDYLDAMQQYKYEQSMVAINVYYAFGVTKVELAPEMKDLEDDTWIDDIESITPIKIEREGRRRRIAWLKYVVLTEDDMNVIMQRIMHMSGAAQEALVAQAAAAFRPDPALDSDNGVGPTEKTERGHLAVVAGAVSDGAPSGDSTST